MTILYAGEKSLGYQPLRCSILTEARQTNLVSKSHEQLEGTTFINLRHLLARPLFPRRSR
jgi:hypothetical protein